MDAALESVAVLADRLQGEGDLRGELLALELAAALAPTSAEGRRLNRAAQSLRATAPELAWPPALADSRGLIRAGLLVAGSWVPYSQARLPGALGPFCRTLVVPVDRRQLGADVLAAAQASVGLQLDELHEERAAAQVLLDSPHQSLAALPSSLRSLGVTRGLDSAAQLVRLRELSSLELGPHRRPDDLFAQLVALELRSLSLRVEFADELRELLGLIDETGVEHLQIYGFAGAFDHRAPLMLRSLGLDYFFGEPEPGPRLGQALVLPRLESLAVRGAVVEDLERVAALGVRRLTLVHPAGPIPELIRALARMDSLEHLRVRFDGHEPIDPAPLAALGRLRSLELGGRFEGELELPASLERLALPSSMARVRAHGRVPGIYVAARGLAETLALLDLERTTTVGIHAWSTDEVPLSSLAEHCPRLEMLALEGMHYPAKTIQAVRTLPNLRGLSWPALTVAQQRSVSEGVPAVQIVGADPARLRGDWPPPTSFDPRTPSCWPKLEQPWLRGGR